MKVRYSLTWKEFVRSQVWECRQMRPVDRAVFFSIIGLLLLLLALFHVYHAYREPYYIPVDVLHDAAIIVFWIIGSVLLWPFLGLRLELELRPEGVVFKRHWEPISMHWSAIEVLDEDAGAIYISFRYKSPNFRKAGHLRILVPKRAFASDSEAQRFFDLAQQYCREAGGHPVAPVYAVRSLPAAQ